MKRRIPFPAPAWISLPTALIIATAWIQGFEALAQPGTSKLKLDTGEEIFKAGCVPCHGPDGKGQAQNLAGFERPSTFPDFADCYGSTPEPDVQWRAVIANGGPARGFSQIMPSFKDLLTPDQINKVIGYLRSLCAERGWPRGDLNLPRALVTEKAFPEDETVIGGSFNASGAPGVGTMVTYEKRIGSSGQLEAVVPYNFVHDTGSWASGFGDITLGYKRKLFASMKTGSIFSVGGEVTAPTGNARIGTGGESTIFETFAAYGQILPANSFFQLQTGTELPAHPDKVPRAYYLRTAFGKSLTTGGGLGRIWSPMVEFIADRDFATGASTNYDVIPQVQIPLSKRMHILGSVGFQVPLNNTAQRAKQVMFYLLWDFADGKVTEGW
jgi:mono/diheme cytochrome c family protein